MYASVNTEQLWFVRQAVITLNYSWNAIHHYLTTAPVPLKLHKKNKMRYNSQEEKKKNNKAKRIICRQDLRRRPELAAVCEFIFISLSVVHTKKWWGTFVCYQTCLKKYYSRRSRFGSCCFPEDEWKSSVACVDCPSLSQRMGLTGKNVLGLADPFPSQEAQDCVVVGGGNHVQKLQRKTLRWRWKE